MAGYICKFVGGPMEGLMLYADALKQRNGMTDDLTEWREHGALVRRPELDNQPTFDGYVGPMWDGDIEMFGETLHVLRYETQHVYDMLSR